MSYEKFKHALLEPLSDEVLRDTQFNRLMREARRPAWRKACVTTYYFEALLEFQRWDGIYAKEISGDQVRGERLHHQSFDTLNLKRHAVAAQILTPAPDAEAVQWKRKAARDSYLPLSAEKIAAVIEADEKWLAAHPAVFSRSSARFDR